MSGVVCSCAGSSCRSVVLDDAEVSVLDRHKSIISRCIVVQVVKFCQCVSVSILALFQL